jgi:ubiquinone/menaquinone biosynthesis C-methylase UbiE
VDNAWTLYWQADRLESADAVKSDADYEPIRAWWRELAAQLEDGATVVDMATGNGTVPSTLLGANPDLKISAVDKAEIDPLRFLSNPGPLANVDFRGRVDVCAMPFADASFDAVTSQFGVEYAPLAEAAAEAVRVLRKGGVLQLLLHCDNSEIVMPARSRRAEMSALLADGGVLVTLRDFVAGAGTYEELEAAGQALRASGEVQTQGITGQIFSGVNQVIGFMQGGDRHAAAELCETMLLRLGADRDRLEALQAAALDEAAFGELVSRLESDGIVTDVAQPLRTGSSGDADFVIGWAYRGRKA